jgi:hypothetical protein
MVLEVMENYQRVTYKKENRELKSEFYRAVKFKD